MSWRVRHPGLGRANGFSGWRRSLFAVTVRARSRLVMPNSIGESRIDPQLPGRTYALLRPGWQCENPIRCGSRLPTQKQCPSQWRSPRVRSAGSAWRCRINKSRTLGQSQFYIHLNAKYSSLAPAPEPIHYHSQGRRALPLRESPPDRRTVHLDRQGPRAVGCVPAVASPPGETG